jgi:hypothetical protein
MSLQLFGMVKVFIVKLTDMVASFANIGMMALIRGGEAKSGVITTGACEVEGKRATST